VPEWRSTHILVRLVSMATSGGGVFNCLLFREPGPFNLSSLVVTASLCKSIAISMKKPFWKLSSHLHMQSLVAGDKNCYWAQPACLQTAGNGNVGLSFTEYIPYYGFQSCLGTTDPKWALTFYRGVRQQTKEFCVRVSKSNKHQLRP
jgi:hypothetical protein